MKNNKKTPAARSQIILVDDHPIVRERLAELINQQPDLAVCCDCDDGPACLALLEKCRPDLAIVDLSLKTGHGLELIKDLQIRHPKLPILVLTMHDEALYAERALRAGARGFVTKQEPTTSIIAAIRHVLAGELYVNEQLAQKLVGALINRPKSTPGPQDLLQHLTDRELEVFQLLSQGHATRQIAESLKIDIKTVETHQARLKETCQVATLEELRRYATLACLDR